MDELIKEIVKSFEDLKFSVTSTNNMYLLDFDGQPSERKYFVSFYEVDGAGTLGIKIVWVLGSVIDESEIVGALALNFNRYYDMGPLYCAVIPMDDDSIRFVLVGQLMFSKGTQAHDITRILFHNAFMNYALFDLNIPGVKMFE